MRAATAVLLVLLVAGLAGCGGEAAPESYALAPTRECLEGAGARVTTSDLDFVATTALGGALRASVAGNQVTVAFGETRAEARRIAGAYRRFAEESIPIDHVLDTELNAVLLWDAPPAEENRRLVEDCLEG